jgi:hypothetical protein
MPIASLACVLAVVSLAACGPELGGKCNTQASDLASDPDNCGACGNVCGEDAACIGSQCQPGLCQPGTVEACYTGRPDTRGVGPCVGGTRTCDRNGLWSKCAGEVVPVAESCTDAIDNNCNGKVDEDADFDGDGFTTCGIAGTVPGDCCDSTECGSPRDVNPGAYDAASNSFDDDCDGIVDNTVQYCDLGIDSNTTSAMDFARAIDLCRVTSLGSYRWGVIDGKISLTDGVTPPDKEGYAVRPRFGGGVTPQGGDSLAMISSGGAAAKTDTSPSYHPWVSYAHAGANRSPFPADWLAANGGVLPNAPGARSRAPARRTTR